MIPAKLFAWALNQGKYLVPISKLPNKVQTGSWQYHQGIRGYLALLDSTMRLPSSEIEAIQEERLKSIFRLLTHVPWWKNRLLGAGIKTSPDSSYRAEIMKLKPVGKKNLISASLKDLIAHPNKTQSLVWRTTTGTDGMPFIWAQNPRSHFIECAAYYLRALKHFSFPVDKNLRQKFFVMFNYPDIENYYLTQFARGVWLTYPKLGYAKLPPKEQRTATYNNLSKNNTWVLYGAPSALWFLAQVIEEDGAAVTPDLVVTSGEMLTDALRVYLRKIFNAEVRSFYGTRELGTIGFSCLSGHNFFHLNSEHILLEILDNAGEKCAPETYGSLVMTSLTNTAMPLLRYKTGDIGRTTNEPCSCNISLPRFELIGRESEFLVLSNDTKSTIWPIYTAILSNGRFDKIKQYQIQQVAKDKILILLIRKPSWTKADYKNLLLSIKDGVEEKLKVEIKFVDSIDTEGRKFKTFIPYSGH